MQGNRATPGGKALRRIRRAVFPLAAAFLSAPLQAAGWLLATDDPRTSPGELFTITLIGAPGARDLPDALEAVIEPPAGGGPRIAVALAATSPASGERRDYSGTWPPEAHGVAMLSVQGDSSARLLLDATPASSAPAALPDGIVRRAPSEEPLEPAPLGFHEPMYFLAGGDPSSARFQLSFRYRIFDTQGVVAETLPMARGLYFGYTQTSLWDLSSDSKPFHDTSFRPSLFYRWQLADPASGASASLQGGYEHESNGKDGPQSRSIDTLFAHADVRYYLADERTYVGISPKVWTYLDKSDNPDIASWRGYGELGLRIGRDDGLLAEALLRRGTAGKGSAQIDLSYPIRLSIFSGVGAFFHLQYFNGYGETLLDYNEAKNAQFRVGVSIVR